MVAYSTSSHVPRVSIGLPVYNGAAYLQEALDSVLSQTFTDFELIICDNASTDATEAICRAAAERDSRIRYERHPENLGAAKNYNSTLARARAPYFRWMCHDDVLAPTCIEACVDVLDTHPNVVVAHTKTQVIDANSDCVASPGWIRNLHLVNMLPQDRFAAYLDAYLWGGDGGELFGLMRTEVLRATMRHGDFPSADLILIGELTLWGDVYQVPEKLFLKRYHDENSIQGTNQEIARLLTWFDPGHENVVRWLEWRWLRELVRAVWYAPLSSSERRRCFVALMHRYAIPHARKYIKEIAYVASARLKLGAHRHPQKVVGLNTMYRIF
ncbi:MAG: glycosyltransferase family 2 protein [Longimonas sp.]|uniref:glycosyltransferase family 2 protein n=1 Tax=Longimonas sp. TaxID=2039626 RepID=UPI00335C8AC6